MNENEKEKMAAEPRRQATQPRQGRRSGTAPARRKTNARQGSAVQGGNGAPSGSAAQPGSTAQSGSAAQSASAPDREPAAAPRRRPATPRPAERRQDTPQPAAPQRGREGSRRTSPAPAVGGGLTGGKHTLELIPAAAETRRPAAPLASGAQARGRRRGKKEAGGALRVIPLGGLQEIGKNITLLEYGEDILVIDCGVAFPDDDMLGVDLVIPDITYLEKNAARVRGIVLTHGHEDHIGSLPYVLRRLRVPVYGTRLTLGIVRNKLEEEPLPYTPSLNTVEAGTVIRLGCFTVEFIHANHSIADACCLAIGTPIGMVFHTGDYKIDVSPIDGKMMDLTRIGEIGNAGVLLMMGESTNSERPGFTPSERKVGGSLEQIFDANPDKRIVIATFSSNVHRVQQIINASAAHGRRVAVIGRSMKNVLGAAVELGYMQVPANVLIDVTEIRRYKPEQITLVTTGSQGEPMSALYRMAFEEHDKVKLGPGDLVVLSASPIPGNEKLVGRVVNALIKNGIRVVNDATADVHVSGHACREEQKMMLALLRPRFFMPVHGECRHLYAHKEIAEFMGINPANIFVSEIGRVLTVTTDSASFTGTVPSGSVLVDGSGVGDVGSVVLRDRKSLSQEGLIVAVATVDMNQREIVSGPDIVSRGFVYVRESEDMMEEARRIAYVALDRALAGGGADWTELKTAVRDALGRYFFGQTKRKPMILPVIMGI